MKPHKNLESWKRSFLLVREVYKVSAGFPQGERFGLTSQIRRAVVSVPSNIAEGAARNSKKEFVHFLYISLGSASELDTLLLLAQDLEFAKSDTFSSLFEELDVISKLLIGLIKKLKTDT